MGRKKIPEEQKKTGIPVYRFLTNKEIEEKGGKEAIQEKLNNAIKKVKL